MFIYGSNVTQTSHLRHVVVANVSVVESIPGLVFGSHAGESWEVVAHDGLGEGAVSQQLF